jgi:hypothetical protein
MSNRQAPYTAPTATGAKTRADKLWEASMHSAETAPGYVTSSFDLRAGLDVRLVAVAQLPADLLREFQRLRQCWAPDEVAA